MNAADRVTLNTSILYGRILVTMGITLYSTRLVLNALGGIDYGIFNLIAGIILMLSFLNAAMATSTQRYLSFHQGKRDLEMQKKVFINSLTLHIVIGLIIVALLELTGLFLFDEILHIPLDRMIAAKTIYHFMSLTVFFTIISTPFNGSLIAHENMFWVALINVVEAILKLIIAVLLYIIPGDKLILYGLLTAGIAIVTFLLYACYCFKRYQECTISGMSTPDKTMVKELGAFAGWNLFGAACSVARTQGGAIILNVFFGAVINTAYGIANQVSAQMNFLSATLLRAINPQIMKSEGAGDRARMLKLAMIASKFSFFLLSIFAIPLIFEMDVVLNLWLGKVPENASVFCSLVLIASLFNQLTIGLQSAIQATGEIKLYQVLVGGVLLMNLPVAYMLLKLGMPAYTMLISFSCIELLACALRLLMAKRVASLRIKDYFDRVLIPEVSPLIFSVITCYGITHWFPMSSLRFLFTGGLSATVFILSAYYIGLCHDEKQIVNQSLSKIFNYFKKPDAKIN